MFFISGRDTGGAIAPPLFEMKIQLMTLQFKYALAAKPHLLFEVFELNFSHFYAPHF
jgi:hypothetical protein